MQQHEKDKAAFLKEVAAHRMTLIRDDGIYRHLRFRNPETIVGSFDLLTWPGHLCYTGDMGTFVFSRVRDMFDFFRRAPHARSGPIDLRYWAEKCLAQDKHGGGITEFAPDLFKEEIKAQRRAILRRRPGLNKEERRRCWHSLNTVISAADEGEHYAFQAAYDWHFKSGQDPLPSELAAASYRQRRQDHSELTLDTSDLPSCRAYTTRFRWCCFALAWGIDLYDVNKGPQAIAA